MDIAVLVPAYNPDARLLAFIDELSGTRRFRAIVVVDDGSVPSCAAIFDQLEAMPGVSVLRHAVNLGKGAALKTGLHYICRAVPICQGAVTADADGQHLVDDVVRIAQQLADTPDSLTLGCRKFSGSVPLRSRLGNIVTKYAFWTLVGRKLEDTQSGLRGVPRGLALELLQSKDSGYEFELDMLIRCRQFRVPIVELPIATVYLEDNRSSHFNPILDSLRIYWVLLRFVAASLVTAALDYLIFVVAYLMGANVFAAHWLARAAGGTLNYALARRVVFHSKAHASRTAMKFALLVVVMGMTSYAILQTLVLALGVPVIAAKIASELIVYIANFLIQRDLVFRDTIDREAFAVAAAEPSRSVELRRAA